MFVCSTFTFRTHIILRLLLKESMLFCIDKPKINTKQCQNRYLNAENLFCITSNYKTWPTDRKWLIITAILIQKYGGHWELYEILDNMVQGKITFFPYYRTPCQLFFLLRLYENPPLVSIKLLLKPLSSADLNVSFIPCLCCRISLLSEKSAVFSSLKIS